MSPADIDAARFRNQPMELYHLARDLSGDTDLQVECGLAESTLCQLARHENMLVRDAAIFSLGRLAYRTPCFDDPETVFAIVRCGLRDPSPTVSGRAAYAARCIAYLHGQRFPMDAAQRD